jgi:RimJ/RimL family protein N-acetyltransferase
MNLKSIEAFVNPSNKKSAKLLERNNFKKKAMAGKVKPENDPPYTVYALVRS